MTTRNDRDHFAEMLPCVEGPGFPPLNKEPREDRGTRLANEAGEPLMDAAAMRLEDELDAMSAMDDAMGLNDYDYTTDDGFDFHGPV